MDDVVLGTETLEEHFQLLRRLLRRMAENDLTLRLSKCRFAYERIEYLGYSVTAEGIRPNDDHIEAIKNIPPPRDLKELRAALGLFNHFRAFIEGHSKIAKPLTEMTGAGIPFDMTPDRIKVFEKLKAKLIDSPILAIYDPQRETELHCDASSIGFGAALMQRQSDKKLHPVSYFSKTATAAESRYHSFELECLAIVYALRRYRAKADVGAKTDEFSHCQMGT